jgi:carbon storage regulator
MLILTRKINEEIKINSDISFKIISISENQVKIGITAPQGVQILRGELYDKVKETTADALQSSKDVVDLPKMNINKIRKYKHE